MGWTPEENWQIDCLGTGILQDLANYKILKIHAGANHVKVKSNKTFFIQIMVVVVIRLHIDNIHLDFGILGFWNTKF